DLGSGEVGIEHEAGALAHPGLPALLLQLPATCRRAPVLPHDRAMQRLAALPLPHHGRLALVRDADPDDVHPLPASRRDRFARLLLGYAPDLPGVVPDPARKVVVLSDLALCTSAN